METPHDPEALSSVLARLEAGVEGGRRELVARALWAHLVERHGPVRDASKLPPDAQARLVAGARVFWVRTLRDGYGGGDVHFTLARVGESLAPRGRHLDRASAYVFTDEGLDVAPWLRALERNPWESANELPGLP